MDPLHIMGEIVGGIHDYTATLTLLTCQANRLQLPRLPLQRTCGLGPRLQNLPVSSLVSSFYLHSSIIHRRSSLSLQSSIVSFCLCSLIIHLPISSPINSFCLHSPIIHRWSSLSLQSPIIYFSLHSLIIPAAIRWPSTI